MLSAAVMSAISLAAQAPTASDAKAEQWLSREVSGEGAVASFLSWNFTSVITRAHCANGRVTFQYFHKSPDSPTLAERPPSLLIDEVPYRLELSVDRMSRQVYSLSDEGARALRQARNVDLDAPNEMNEPWYMGQATALVRLAEGCG